MLTAELGKTSPETRAVVTDLYDRWEAQLAAGARAVGAERPGEVARGVLTAIQGGVVMLRSTGRVTYLETALDLMLVPLMPKG